MNFAEFCSHAHLRICRRKPCCVLKLELRFIKATQKQPGAGERGNPVPAKARPGKHSGGMRRVGGGDHLKLSAAHFGELDINHARAPCASNLPHEVRRREVPRCTQSAIRHYIPVGILVGINQDTCTQLRIVKECRVSPSSALPGWSVYR